MINMKGKLKQSLVGLALLSVSGASFAANPFNADPNNVTSCFIMTFGYYDTGVADAYSNGNLWNHCDASQITSNTCDATEKLFFQLSNTYPYEGLSLQINTLPNPNSTLFNMSNKVVRQNTQGEWLDAGLVHEIHNTNTDTFVISHQIPFDHSLGYYDCKPAFGAKVKHYHERLTFTRVSGDAANGDLILNYQPTTGISASTNPSNYKYCNYQTVNGVFGPNGGWSSGEAVVVLDADCNGVPY